MRYQIRFSFDVQEGMSPRVLICDTQKITHGQPYDVFEVFDLPKPKKMGKIWSTDPDDWEPPSRAMLILGYLNGRDQREEYWLLTIARTDPKFEEVRYTSELHQGSIAKRARYLEQEDWKTYGKGRIVGGWPITREEFEQGGVS